VGNKSKPVGNKTGSTAGKCTRNSTYTGNLELIFDYKSDLIITNLGERAVNDTEKSDEKLQELNTGTVTGAY
jgi:hypothetical protein